MNSPSQDVIVLPADRLKKFACNLFNRVGVPRSVYIQVTDGLIETSLRGVDSHGIRLLPHYVHAVVLGRIKRTPRFTFKKTGLSTGILDADHSFGIAAGTVAIDHAIKLALRSGVGVVTVTRSSHFGAAAIFGLRAAHAGMLGLVYTDVDALVFPYGAKKTYFGTNPLCFTAPIEGEDAFCLDMASSRVTLNKILSYKESGKELERGWAIDSSGRPTTNPARAVSPQPMGDYKGYGLAAMVSILSSVLSGMPFGPAIHPMYPLDNGRRNIGHFFMAIDISRFRPLGAFKKDMGRMAKELRSLPPVQATIPVMIPGDPEKNVYANRIIKGIPVPSSDLRAFRSLSVKFHVPYNLET